MSFWLIAILLPAIAICQHEGVLDIEYPSIRVLSQAKGNISLQAGVGGNVHLTPGKNGSVYLDDVDLLEIIRIVRSLPPIWSDHSSLGDLGEFQSGKKINYQLTAEDPEGGAVTYSVVAGILPPGVHLTRTGTITGILPETDTTFRFAVRATDIHGKFSDLTFHLDVKAYFPCTKQICKNGGSCFPKSSGEHECHCIHPTGGKNCELDCQKNVFGVANNLKHIPDAQMSAHNTLGINFASNGRLANPTGWYGVDHTSWLQIDLGKMSEVHAVAQQSLSATAYTSAFHLHLSVDGNSFAPYNGTNKLPYTFTATATAVVKTTLLPEVATARFIRFLPITYTSHPLMRVEVYGCHLFY